MWITRIKFSSILSHLLDFLYFFFFFILYLFFRLSFFFFQFNLQFSYLFSKHSRNTKVLWSVFRYCRLETMKLGREFSSIYTLYVLLLVLHLTSPLFFLPSASLLIVFLFLFRLLFLSSLTFASSTTSYCLFCTLHFMFYIKNIFWGQI